MHCTTMRRIVRVHCVCSQVNCCLCMYTVHTCTCMCSEHSAVATWCYEYTVTGRHSVSCTCAELELLCLTWERRLALAMVRPAQLHVHVSGLISALIAKLVDQYAVCCGFGSQLLLCEKIAVRCSCITLPCVSDR